MAQDIDDCIRAALRFRVGETVECCVNPDLGLWARGTVTMQFFREKRWADGVFPQASPPPFGLAGALPSGIFLRSYGHVAGDNGRDGAVCSHALPRW